MEVTDMNPSFEPAAFSPVNRSQSGRMSQSSMKEEVHNATKNMVRRTSEKLRSSRTSSMSGSSTIRGDDHSIPHLNLVYALAFFVFCTGYFIFHDAGFSTILTVSSGIDFFAFVSLTLNVLWRQSTAGISKKMVFMEMLVRAFRLSSTLFFRGYLPADSTGSGAFQLCDIGTLVCTLSILLCTTVFRTEEQEEQDMNFPLTGAVCGCLLLALLIHPGLNNNFVFDTTWTASLYICVVSMMPQLMMIMKVHEEMDALSVHFVAAITLSRVLNATFWYYAFEELAPSHGGWNISGYFVIMALFGQVFLMMDFGYYYIKALVLRGKYYRRGGVFC